jgi:hypothetical protein
MEQLIYAARFSIARRLHRALCERFPDRHFELSDTQAVNSARNARTDAPESITTIEVAAASLIPD